MYIDLAGQWQITLWDEEGHKQSGEIALPGILQAQGYGNEISRHTPWVSSLHDESFWEREEVQYAQGYGFCVSFLAQPPKHFLGKAFYEKRITIKEEKDDTWYLYIELTHWRTRIYVDGIQTGEDCSLCTAHTLHCGRLGKGEHTLRVEIDNSMQYPYRPDAHSVSDALGATWNGMAGEIALMTAWELEARQRTRRIYAIAHPRNIKVTDGRFYVDGRAEYFRGTHFGGDYPLTGYPITDVSWWRVRMRQLKEWGLNFIRCHSYCPPEAAFEAADEEDVYIQPECGMWNHFEEESGMLDVLRTETHRILKQFGHHPSFVLFSPTNEPSGNWYQVLREWVEETREYDAGLGYAGRRVYTAQSGWFYDVEPSRVQGTDYLYFHRSGYGPYIGGTIRGMVGWKGSNYSPSLEHVTLPVITHELGQWCVYPDFSIIERMNGYLHPYHYLIFREHCRASGLLELNAEFVRASGRNQVRLYKEDIEANLRTQEIQGFELLDLHDYLGQGTAQVGMLDALWQPKGYVSAEEFRQFCSETVLLAAFDSYVFRAGQQLSIPVSVCHYGKKQLRKATALWELSAIDGKHTVIEKGSLPSRDIECGTKTALGSVVPNVSKIWAYVNEHGHSRMEFSLEIKGVTKNRWELFGVHTACECMDCNGVVYTHDWKQALQVLTDGGSVIFAPYLSNLDNECPPLSIRNVFWNAQMGPTWGRSLGMLADTAHPLFRRFPTASDGGWQWEDILEHARGFCLRGSLLALQPLVRVIDDWNRNLPLALIWEARVGTGKLLCVSADLDGDVTSRPAAYALRMALLGYAASESFAPTQEIQPADVELSFFPLQRMEELAVTPSYDIRMTQETYPIILPITLRKTVKAQGILYVPAQRERMRDGFPKEISIQIWNQEEQDWKTVLHTICRNTTLSQRLLFDQPYLTDRLRVLVHSCYGSDQPLVWAEDREGYHPTRGRRQARVVLDSLHIICDEKWQHHNMLFWKGHNAVKTKEIEV